MGLTPGTRLGTYEIVSPIGAGGMGEVYRARDTKLDRDVAIKVLPPHLASDPEALARFEREAKAVAALSHPNILSIHDYGREGGVSFAAMELLEGGTLRERLASGALPPKKVVQIGVDIAQGLAAAHARGIVHRDLKPENVFVTTDGRVKILDFGLARPMAMTGDGTNSPTALQQTDPGTILGTVGYMSPEQVKGQPADHRSDVFSLGCVLYELATGRRAFQRETAAETMTAILREDAPELSRDSGASPAAIEPVIRHCLEKQPDERFQSARDLAFALQALSGTTTSSGSSAKLPSGITTAEKRRLPIVPIAAAAVVLVAAAFFAGQALAPAASGDTHALAFQQLTDDAGVESNPSMSPDGVSVAFARLTKGQWDIYVQRVGGRTSIPIAADPAHSEGAPAFSPDGASIAFHVLGGKGGIFVAGATGESARRLTDFGFHPAWSPDGHRLVFCTEAIANPLSRSAISTLWVVDAKGGTPRKILDGDGVEPVWSPSGQRIAYWTTDNGQRDLYTIPADGGERLAVTSDAPLDASPTWSADGRFLYFSSDRGGSMNIWRIGIDEASGRPRGVPEAVTAGVTAASQPSLSKDGSKLVFRSATFDVNPVALPFDAATERVGTPRPILDRTGSLGPTGASPDGQWLVLSNLFERQEDIFIVQTDGTGMRRLTDDAFRDRLASWSPDGKELAFYSNRSGNYAIWAIKPDGMGLRRITEEAPGLLNGLLYPVYSPTGDRMVASRVRTPETFLFDPRRPWSEQKPERLPTTMPDGSWINPSAWSPNGRLLAGNISSASGVTNGLGVYDLEARTVRMVDSQATSGFGAAWLSDSRRLVYGFGGGVWLLDIESGRRREILQNFPTSFFLAVSPDNKTIYVGQSRQQADLWIADLKAKAK